MSAIPGLSAPVFNALQDAMQGKPINNVTSPVRRVRRRFFHAQALGAALLASYTAFNVAKAKGVTNIINNGNFPNDTCFVIRSVHVWIESGISVAGAADAEGAQIGSHATAPTQDPLAQWLYQVHKAGIFTLKVGDFTVIDSTKDLTTFPSGAGMSVQAALATNSATTKAYEALVTQNGSPDARNVYWIEPYAVTPGFPLEATIEWPTAINPPSNVDAVLMCAVDGQYITSGR